MDNILKAYRNLIDGNSPLSGNISTRRINVNLEPTHYHVKLTPKTRDKVFEIYDIDGIEINLYPFDMIAVNEDICSDWEITQTRNTKEDEMVERYYHIPEEVIGYEGE